MKAAENGHTAIVDLLLSTSEVEPDSGFDSKSTSTALLLAVQNGHEATVDLLLGVSQVPLDFKYGGIFIANGPTLLSAAEKIEHEGIIKLLQKAMEANIGEKK